MDDQQDTRFIYRGFSSGNGWEFPGIDEELARRNITTWHSDLPTGGRIYRMLQEELDLFPRDDRGPYFPSAIKDAGYTISHDGVWEVARIRSNGTDWVKHRGNGE